MTITPARRDRTGALSPGEVARAAVTAALCSAIAVTTVALPFAFGLTILGVVPMALLARRERMRVVVATVVAASILTFLGVGLGGPCVIAVCAYMGVLIGRLQRRGEGILTTLTAFAVSLAASTVFAVALTGLLTALADLRHLVLDAITVYTGGLASVMSAIPGLGTAGAAIAPFTETLIENWQIVVITASMLGTSAMAAIGWWTLKRLPDHETATVRLEPDNADEGAGPIAPTPLVMHAVRYRYPGADHDALGPLTATIDRGERVAVTGANGSGKTTLLRLLAGQKPTGGTIGRAGAVGLGRCGGTAIVMQHPESQVLGTRVADDVIWGLPADVDVDIDDILDQVGMAGFGDRDTTALSGGELQRLAIGAALARRPQLLVADEITSMVDQPGREELLRTLREVTERYDTALVHITHYDTEASAADRTITLPGARPRGEHPQEFSTLPNTPVTDAAPGDPSTRSVVLELRSVGYEYGLGTPWQSSALRDITFSVHQGDGLLIHGLNGSGKSTLAWIMAGLTEPTSGQCLLAGAPVADQVGKVALSFQAARLQAMGNTVATEIAETAGLDFDDQTRIGEAVGSVGLDASLLHRPIRHLSGGQIRRVVLAGLLARRPRVLILDEPLAGLDSTSTHELLRLLTRLRHDGLTIVVISHDFSGLEALCTRALHLRHGDLTTPMVNNQEGQPR
ncbi:ATP-binding cassette domain-containing protein [Mycolicibacterium vinylchloridicum]|uniref:ATP-binding cassette domain-containing protein n=1 Tax=Mycolicibacterium vinylchloridicum TaxID=2736928 RepID=UPI00022E8D85|nr:ATP-binding cassette domain-containing protein [Mycolicibacterium vinylchloridicum]EHB53316.1 Monosaccharide-transporting ATPase [Mycolicibacterium rhodesiae JS60]